MNKQKLIKKTMIFTMVLAMTFIFAGCTKTDKNSEADQVTTNDNSNDSVEVKNSNGDQKDSVQEIKKTKNIEIILDASGSMKAKISSGKTKMAAAREAIEQLLNGLDDSSIRLAIRAYGHQFTVAQHNCEDTQLLFPLSVVDKNSAMNKINSLSPQGYTPIGYSLQKAANDFPASQEGVSNVIILVSDGEETCDANPCEVAEEMKKSGIETTIHTIGFNVDSVAEKQLQCIADASGGKYFDAKNADDLATVLLEAVNNELTYGRFTIQTFDMSDNPMAASVFIRDQKTGKSVKNALNELDGHGSGNDGIYSYLYEPGEYKVDIGNILIQENITLKAGEEKIIKVYLSELELTTKNSEVIFKIKTTSDSLVDAQMVKAGKTWIKKLPAGDYKIIKEMINGKLTKDEYQFFTIKRGEKMKIEL